MSPRFRFLRPSVPLPDSWLSLLRRPYEDEWFTNFGPLTTDLATEVVARFPAGAVAIPVANATVGLQAALLATDVVGKRVIVPSFTFPATLHAVTAAGGIPHIVDVDRKTWQLDASSIPWNLNHHGPIGAIVPVKTFGATVDDSELLCAAAENGVPVVIDAAAAFPTVGITQSMKREAHTLRVYSFHATKPLSIGEGGVIVGPAVSESALRSTTNFGLGVSGQVTSGTNAKMDEFAAARAIAALQDFDTRVQRRRLFVRSVYEAADLSSFMLLPSDEPPTWSFFPLLCPSAEISSHVMEVAKEAGVETRRYYSPELSTGFVGSFPLLAEECPVSRSLSERMVCFPVYADATAQETQELREIFLSIIEAARN